MVDCVNEKSDSYDELPERLSILNLASILYLVNDKLKWLAERNEVTHTCACIYTCMYLFMMDYCIDKHIEKYIEQKISVYYFFCLI